MSNPACAELAVFLGILVFDNITRKQLKLLTCQKSDFGASFELKFKIKRNSLSGWAPDEKVALS